jgi:poly-gamma-glutamate synthesis protein (capsule biosynthesis protein)
VDVIAGSHPHVVQTTELYSSSDGAHQMVCFYSQGNFLSNQRATNIDLTTGQSEDGIVFSFTFVEYSDGSVFLESVDMLPTWVLIRSSGNNRTCHILPLDENIADWNAAFDLSASQSSDAKASLKRTQDLIAADFEAVRASVDQMATTHRQTLGIFSGGVG